MRVLHLGNVANNGYINAKLQRRLGVEADAVCDERHIISQPEWEEVDVPVPSDHLESIRALAEANGWQRPGWIVPVFDPFERRLFKGQYWLAYRQTLLANLPRLRALYGRLYTAYGPLRAALGRDLTFGDLLAGFRVAWLHRLLLNRRLAPFFHAYDIVQAYATHPIITLVTTPDHPYVAFEHGTLRDIPFEDTSRGRMMSLSYRLAHKVIVTNADVIGAIRVLGLDNTVFVPHPIDEQKYSPGDSTLRAELAAGGAELVLFSPARHDWDEKGNDLMLRGFADLMHRGHPGAVLVLSSWGKEIARSKGLIHELGCDRNVRWLPPLTKERLLDAYRAADVVLDQFLIGTFGGIAPEAMAVGKPVVMAFDPHVHEWCYPELPPILPARTTNEIAAQLRRLAEDGQERVRLGQAGRRWIERHHGWRLVVGRQLAIYDEIKELREAGARPPLPA